MQCCSPRSANHTQNTTLGFRWSGGSHQQPVLRIGHRNAFHDDVIKWIHFPRYWAFVQGIHRSPVFSSHKGQWRGALMFSLICAWTNDWANNGGEGDLRRSRVHYDVTLMPSIGCQRWDILQTRCSVPEPTRVRHIFACLQGSRHYPTIGLPQFVYFCTENLSRLWMLFTPALPRIGGWTGEREIRLMLSPPYLVAMAWSTGHMKLIERNC